MPGKVKHGLHKSKEYQAWADMKTRCVNSNNSRYKDYGGRGIKVCERWQIFENFYADMGSKPDKSSLDRINNDGDYKPGNCRWALWHEQFANRRTSKLTEIKVKIIKYAVELGLTHAETGKLFGVAGPTITNIVNNKSWRHVE